MELLASKFSWKVLKKLILQAPQEPSNLASDEEVGGGDTDGVQGINQQGGGVEVQDLGEQMNSSSSENLAAQPLVPEELSEYEKVRAANVKEKEGLLRQLKRDRRGFKESEGFAMFEKRKGAKKLKVLEKEGVNTRSVENAGTSGTGLDNGYAYMYLELKC